MMKKNGFTLAEVLITLAIIGVVATMTLPALMTNTQEQQARTGLKKGINSLTEAAQMNRSLEGWDFGSANEDANEDGIVTDFEPTTQAFDSLIATRMTVDYAKGVQLPPNGNVAETGATHAVYFRDGSAIYYSAADLWTEENAANLDDRLPVGYVVFYDTNGATGPNILSNCTNTPLGANETIESVESIDDFVTPVEATEACTRANRVMRDIFAVRLRGDIAQPEGAASTWLINGDVREAAEGE